MRHKLTKKKELKNAPFRKAYVLRAPQSAATRHLGRLLIGGRTYPCALGKAGITGHKREGDSATPRATMPVLAGQYRADRTKRPVGHGSFWNRIDKDDGWCDAPFTPAYNQSVTLPHTASHEVMTREDHLYDRLIILDWNMRVKAQMRGSAIFFHQARITDGQLQATEGCIALPADVFAKLAPRLAQLRMIKVL